MPNHASAFKRMRQNIKRRARNRIWRSRLRTIETKLRRNLAENPNIEENEALLREFSSIFEKAVNKGIIHKNKAARKCSTMHRALNNKKATASSSE